MKKIKLLCLALLIGISASAQTARVTASYDLSKLSNTDEKTSVNFYGASVNYSSLFKISKNSPLFMEVGAGVSYGSYGFKEQFIDYDNSGWIYQEGMNVVSVSVPVKLVYSLAITKCINLEPFVGLGLKINALASSSVSYQDSVDSSEDYNLKYNMLSDIEVDDSWNIAQMNAQFGIGINLYSIYVGLSYIADITKLNQSAKYNTLSLSVGYNF